MSREKKIKALYVVLQKLVNATVIDYVFNHYFFVKNVSIFFTFKAPFNDA